MFRKFLLVISLGSFFWINLLPKNSTRLDFDRISVNKIVSRKIIKLSKEVSTFILSSQFNLYEIESLLNSFSSILESNSNINLRPSEVRQVRKDINNLELLMNGIVTGDICKNDRPVIEKIIKLLDIFKILLDNPKIVDNGIWTLCLDHIYHKPVEFIGKHKIGTSMFLILAALFGTGFHYSKTSIKNNDDSNISGLVVDNPENNLFDNVIEGNELEPNIGVEDSLLMQNPLDEEEDGLNTQDTDLEFPFSDVLDSSGYVDESFFGIDDLVATNISEEDLLVDLDLSDLDEVDNDRALFARETNTRYDFRKPSLNMSPTFRRKIGTGCNLGNYRTYLRLFD